MNDQSFDESSFNPDDSILSKRGYVKDSLNLIGEKKERLKEAMKTVSEAEQPDLELMSKLLAAYDSMTKQENQYLEVMKSIVVIHEHAVEDVAKDLAISKSEVPALPEVNNIIPKSDKPAENPATDTDIQELVETLKEIHEVSKQTALAAQVNEQLQERLNLHKKKKANLQEIRRDKAKELQQKSSETMTTVELTKKKIENERNSKKHLEKELDRLRKAALQKGIELGIVEDQMKDAAIKAISHLTDEAHRIPPTTDETPEERDEKPELTEEEKLEQRRIEIRENVRKERERKEQVNQLIREKLLAFEARKERVRQLREMLEFTNKQVIAQVHTEKLKAEAEAAGQAAAESAEQAKEVVPEKLSDKTEISNASSEVKENPNVEPTAEEPAKAVTEEKASPAEVQPSAVEEVKETSETDDLPKIDDEQQDTLANEEDPENNFDNLTEEERHAMEQAQKELNETLRNATMNLQNLQLMRMRLEDLHSRGGDLSAEEAHFIEMLEDTLPPSLDDLKIVQEGDEVDEVDDDKPPPPPTSSPPASPVETEIEDIVRQKFVSAFKLKSARSLLDSFSPVDSAKEQKPSITNLQLDRMEVLLRQQMNDIGQIREMVCPAASNLSITKSALLRASSSLLSSLADVLSQMASGQHTSARELDNLLIQLYQADSTVISNTSPQETTNHPIVKAPKGVLIHSQGAECSKEEYYQPNADQKHYAHKQKNLESVRFANVVEEKECERQHCDSSSSSMTSSSDADADSDDSLILHTTDGGFGDRSGPSSPEPVELTSILRQRKGSDCKQHVPEMKRQHTLERATSSRIDKLTEDNEDIRRIVETIIRILSYELRSSSVLTPDICQSLLDLIITLASQHFQRVPLDLLQAQLGSVVSDTVNPYVDSSMIENRKQFMRELSSILLNELSFFHVLDSVKAVPDK
ncbi:unnamed protein product [Auanema sp. JU1783]|nr:unnamed protein product [Auanema sp. JU1783]